METVMQRITTKDLARLTDRATKNHRTRLFQRHSTPLDGLFSYYLVYERALRISYSIYVLSKFLYRKNLSYRIYTHLRYRILVRKVQSQEIPTLNRYVNHYNGYNLSV